LVHGTGVLELSGAVQVKAILQFRGDLLRHSRNLCGTHFRFCNWIELIAHIHASTTSKLVVITANAQEKLWLWFLVLQLVLPLLLVLLLQLLLVPHLPLEAVPHLVPHLLLVLLLLPPLALLLLLVQLLPLLLALALVLKQILNKNKIIK
jgi:hypothetical protein